MKRYFQFLLKTVLTLFLLLNIVVIFHAYKFTHYYERNETVIKSNSDKNGWNKTAEMFFGINAVKRQNAVPDSAFETIRLFTNDSLKLEAWLRKVPRAKGTIAMFHGHGGEKSGVLPEAYAFQQMGYNTLLLDFRAHGSSAGNTCTIGYKESEDVKIAYEYLQRTGEKNINLWGISMGAAAITKAVNDYNLAPSKIVLEMPFASLTEAVEGRLRLMKLPVQPVSTLLTFWGGTIHGFWAFGLKPSEYAKKIKCPVLVQWGRNDPRVTEKETMAVLNNISAEKKLVIFESSGHQSLCANEHGKWVTEVSTFLSK